MQLFLNLKSTVSVRRKAQIATYPISSISMISEKGQIIGLEIISDC